MCEGGDHFWSLSLHTAFSAAHPGPGAGEPVIPECAFAAGLGSQQDSLWIYTDTVGLPVPLITAPQRRRASLSSPGICYVSNLIIEYHSALPDSPAAAGSAAPQTLRSPCPSPTVQRPRPYWRVAEGLASWDTQVPTVLWCPQPHGWSRHRWAPACPEPWSPRSGLDST